MAKTTKRGGKGRGGKVAKRKGRKSKVAKRQRRPRKVTVTTASRTVRTTRFGGDVNQHYATMRQEAVRAADLAASAARAARGGHCGVALERLYTAHESRGRMRAEGDWSRNTADLADQAQDVEAALSRARSAFRARCLVRGR